LVGRQLVCWLRSIRCHAGNDLAAMATVNSKTLVGCDDDGLRKRFGHANQARIGEAHWNVGIFLDQLHDWLYVFGNGEGHPQSEPGLGIVGRGEPTNQKMPTASPQSRRCFGTVRAAAA
jgi:hypothetical protein